MPFSTVTSLHDASVVPKTPKEQPLPSMARIARREGAPISCPKGSPKGPRNQNSSELNEEI